MWKINDDGNHAFNDDDGKSLSISPAYTVMQWQITPSDDPNYKVKWEYTPLETFDSEAAARVYIKKFVERRNSNADPSQ